MELNDNSKVDVEIKKPEVMNNELMVDVKSELSSAVIPSKPADEITVDVPDDTFETPSITNSEFAITIVKSVTGTGCLGIPFSMVQMGIIPTIIVFFLVTVANIINTRYLIESNEGLKRRQLSMKEGLKIDNDYANLMYQLFGLFGYYLFLLFFFLTVWGVMLGTMISMVDFLNHLPFPEASLGGPQVRNLLFHVLSGGLCYMLCLIRDTKKLYFVSWFGIFTLILSYLVVIIYGLFTIRIQFNPSLLFSSNLSNFFANLGVAPYTLGYNFCFLTYYKQVQITQQSKTFKTTVGSIFSVFAVYMLFAIPATVIYGSVRNEQGEVMIASNLVNSLPDNSVWGVLINVLMWISCVCSVPVLLPSTSEVLEKNCPEMKPTFFVQDKGRLVIRFAQVAGLLMIAYLLPFFGDIINVIGGFAFVATSILIPVIVHFLVFKQTMSTKQKMIHLLLGTASFLLMVVATYFSAASLIKNLLQ